MSGKKEEKAHLEWLLQPPPLSIFGVTTGQLQGTLDRLESDKVKPAATGFLLRLSDCRFTASMGERP